MGPLRTLPVLFLAATVFAGCIDDGPSIKGGDAGAALEGPPNAHPAYGFPVYQPVDGRLAGGWDLPTARPLPASLTALAGGPHVEGTTTGGGIAVFGTYAVIGGRGAAGPLQVVDISDPSAPVLAGSVADVPVRDADTIAYPDGRLVVITTAGGDVQFATDITDKTKPALLAEIQTPHGNHNLAVVPGTPIVYNSGSDGLVDVVDYSDPESPQIVGAFQNDEGCHDITFYIDASTQKYRAYCAAYPETQIWDITDPLVPQMLTRVPYPTMEQGAPAAGGMAPETAVFPLSFSHLAMVNHDASMLIVGDETGGGAINGCDVYADTPGGTVSGPLGNLWFYDLSDEAAPELLGHVSPSFADAAGGSCTAHFGRLVEDTGFLVMGFYAAGVVLVDFNDPTAPRIVDRYDPPAPDGGSIWDVWYYQGYLFTGDMSRGMDVLTFE